MKILLYHPVQLPPRDYGGTERVVLWLARGLRDAGHDVTVAALEGSQLPRGISLLPISPKRRSALDSLGLFPRGLDVVHFMAPPEPGVWASMSCGGILTVHGNGKPGERFPRNSVFLSQDHARRHGAEVFVHNGIDPDECRFEPARKEESYLFLSKTSWRVKNVAGAIRYCAKARVGLKIAGGWRPWGQRIRTLIAPSMRWIGPVSGELKASLLSQAKALLFPVTWPEPFGLVVAEALMSGTPVIASPKGSLPELITSDVGALLNSDAEWIEMLQRRQLPWDPEACRARAMERFHFRRMAEKYEGLYRRISAGEILHTGTPVAADWRER